MSAGSSNELAEAEMSSSRIPKAPFIEDVVAHLGSADEPIEPAMSALSELASKYKFMELQLSSRQQAMESKIPDIQQTLDMVKALSADSVPEKVHFELSETLYAEAKLPLKVDSVSLWLGANVMLEYPLKEAEELLSSKLSSAKKARDSLEAELEFLREQITTVQVNTSRLYNFDVVRRRQVKA